MCVCVIVRAASATWVSVRDQSTTLINVAKISSLLSTLASRDKFTVRRFALVCIYQARGFLIDRSNRKFIDRDTMCATRMWIRSGVSSFICRVLYIHGQICHPRIATSIFDEHCPTQRSSHTMRSYICRTHRSVLGSQLKNCSLFVGVGTSSSEIAHEIAEWNEL